MKIKTAVGMLILVLGFQAQAWPGQGAYNYLMSCVFSFTGTKPWTIPVRIARNSNEQTSNSVVWWPEEVIRFPGPKVDRILEVLPIELPLKLKDQLVRNEKYFRAILLEGEVEPYVVFYSDGRRAPARSYFKITKNGIVIPNGPAADLGERVGPALNRNELWAMVNSWVAPAQFKFDKQSAKGELPDIIIPLDGMADVIRQIHESGVNIHALGALSTRFRP